MSRSEDEVKSLLTPVFHGQPARWDEAAQTKVARWVFKTALMLDRSSLASRVAPAEHFSHLYREQAPPKSALIYLAQYFPAEGETPVGVIGSSYRPTGVDPRLYPNPYEITFSVAQAIFQVFGHTGTAALEIKRAGYRAESGLVVPVIDQFRQVWPLRGGVYEWPPQGGYLTTHNLEVLARF